MISSSNELSPPGRPDLVPVVFDGSWMMKYFVCLLVNIILLLVLTHSVPITVRFSFF
jgi:hypothetical protein